MTYHNHALARLRRAAKNGELDPLVSDVTHRLCDLETALNESGEDGPLGEAVERAVDRVVESVERWLPPSDDEE